jgi:hypothetical protein
MLKWEGLLTEYKSLVGLHEAALQNANAGVLHLERLDQHRFRLSNADQVSHRSPPKNGFVYGLGFVEAQNQTKSSAIRRRGLVFGTAAFCLVFLAVAALTLAPKTENYVKQPVVKSSLAARKTEATVKSTVCRPETQQANAAANKPKLPASVLQSQIIGGFRELTLVSSCDQKPYQVVMYLENHVWKAKSATPVGSHSQS